MLEIDKTMRHNIKTAKCKSIVAYDRWEPTGAKANKVLNIILNSKVHTANCWDFLNLQVGLWADNTATMEVR